MELTKEYLLDALPTQLLGRKLYAFERIDSTNNCARALADVGAEEGTVVVAEFQTEGRGRLGRSWAAEPRSNLLFSVLIRPSLSLEQAVTRLRERTSTLLTFCRGRRLCFWRASHGMR